MSTAPLSERLQAAERLAETRRIRQSLAMAKAAEWLQRMFPEHVRRPFAPHQAEVLDWGQEIDLDTTPRPFVGIWARGGGKSTIVELTVAKLGLQDKRKYCLYISATQAQADAHVLAIAGLFESESVDRHYPGHAERWVGKHGNIRGWRRNRIRTKGGFTVDALGLDTAARGAKIDADRPDLIILDDVDSETDTPRTTQRKVDLITRSILPAGTANCAVIGIQNLVHAGGVFAQLADGRADFLATRIVSGPIPAVYNLRTVRRLDEDTQRYRDFVVGGEPSWPGGQSLEDCQRVIDRIGLSAFLTECQHEVHERVGALWNRRMIVCGRVAEPPRNDDGTLNLRRIGIGIDPSGGKSEVGIVAAGIRGDKAYVLRDATVPGALGPRAWATAAVGLYHELKADFIAVERNYGGAMCEHTIRTVDPRVRIIEVTASRGKLVRAEPIASLYGTDDLGYVDSCVHHVGTFAELESELCSWVPGDPSPNRLDALVWVLTELMTGARRVDPDSLRIVTGGPRPLYRELRGFCPENWRDFMRGY
ncbi:MAG: hypothetical protein KJO98_16995 [Rhodothermia bacterium]|nr:hypothetical protein [Rhodothermia bacterium]